MNPPKKAPEVKLSVDAIKNMRQSSEQVVMFSIDCMRDVVTEEDAGDHLAKAYSAAIYVNQKFADYLQVIEETKPTVFDERSQKEKYVLEMQDLFMIEALVTAKLNLLDDFPAMTGGRSLEKH